MKSVRSIDRITDEMGNSHKPELAGYNGYALYVSTAETKLSESVSLCRNGINQDETTKMPSKVLLRFVS